MRHRGIARAVGHNASPPHQIAANAFNVPILGAEGNMLMALSFDRHARHSGKTILHEIVDKESVTWTLGGRTVHAVTVCGGG